MNIGVLDHMNDIYECFVQTSICFSSKIIIPQERMSILQECKLVPQELEEVI